MTEIDIALDRLTIVGELQHMPRRVESILEPQALGGFRINCGDVFAYVNSVGSGKGKWRADFNPAHITETNELKTFLHNLKDKHYSRKDVAFDVYNVSEFMNYRFLNASSSEKWFSKGKQLETIYYGAYGSKKLLRQYDKKVEQLSKGIVTSHDYWGRYEMQLRHKFTDDWYFACSNCVNNFILPEYAKIPYNERAILYAIQNNVVKWSELSKPTRKKYRDLVLDYQGNQDTNLSGELQVVLDESKKELEDEMQYFLNI